jgi:hypothetical protein
MLRLMIKQDGRVGRKAEPRPGPSVRGEAAQRKNDCTGRCVRSGNRGCEKSRRPLLRKLLAWVEAHGEVRIAKSVTFTFLRPEGVEKQRHVWSYLAETVRGHRRNTAAALRRRTVPRE